MVATLELISGTPRKNALPSATGTVRSAGDAAQGLFLRKALVLSSAVASAFLCSSPALASFEYVTHWGRFDTSGANAAFNGPTDVAFLKSNGNLVIVDSNAGVTGGGEVVIQQTDGTYVTKVASVNTLGPVRAAVDPNSGDVYLSTYYESKIRHYTEAGGALTLAHTWTGCTANGGNGPYNWTKTFGVAVDSTGAIYVNDYDNLRIIKMNTSGQCLAAPLTTYTKNGTPGQVFLNLTGLAVDSADNVWAADYGQKVVVKYNSTGVWQTTLTGFTNCGTTTAFDSPKDIDIDTTTNDMFITDNTNGFIKLDSSGNFLTKATKYNTNTSFSVPFGGGFTSGFYYATDYGHSAVVKYQNPVRKVSVTASAGGTVAADVGGVITGTTGGNTCTDQFVDASTVVLTATPAGGYTTTWGGADGAACTGNTCTLTNIGADQVVTATFTSASTPTQPSAPPPLPTGGGSATLTGGQSVTVADNGGNGTTINLPPPPATIVPGATAPSVNITLPGTGAIGVSSGTGDTQLGVTHVTLPGTTTSVSTVTVNQGSATFTASQAGQAVAGLKNGIVVVSGAKDSQVTVDATGENAKIGVKSSDTIIVPTGTPNVSGTSVDLPSPTATGGAASTVNLNIGGQELTIQSSQPNTTMTFQVVDVGGVQTPVLAVTGNARVTTGGEDKPIVSIAGNVIKSGKSAGGGGQVCNTVVQANSNASSDSVHVVTCYIVLAAGSFSGLEGAGNGFAAIKDGKVWAGETAEFDKNGKVIAAYLGSRSGDSAEVGDDVVPGGAKFAGAEGYHINAFIPRLAGTSLRLNGARLDESIFNLVNASQGLVGLPTIPGQSGQGVFNFQLNGSGASPGLKNSYMTYTINGDTVSLMPSRRVRVDTSRADGVSISAEGGIDIVTGGLVTTFVPAFIDPAAFAEKVGQALPGSVSTLRWNGSWQVNAADGTTYIGRPLWSFWSATPGAETFTTSADGNLLLSGNFGNNKISQQIFPDFYDYDTLQATFRTELNDPTLSILPRMDGTAVASSKNGSYTLAPQWTITPPTPGKPAWWKENGVFYIKNSDGTAQGFTVK